MFSSRFVRWLRLRGLGAAPAVSDRALSLVFTARFTDELLSGAWTVLAPSFRSAFRLSLVSVGLLTQATGWVALVVEPPAAVLIDVSSRRRLIGFGAACLAVSIAVMGIAPVYWVLLVGFLIYGLGSGPLAHPADVVIVEAFPETAQRAFTRATFLDTVGALAGPAVIAVCSAVGLSWRAGLVALATWAAVYAACAMATPLPPPPRVPHPSGLLSEIVGGIRGVLGDRQTRQPLLGLLAFEVFEAAFTLKYVWLHEAVGLSQAAVAGWAAVEQVVDLVALGLLDRWLRRWDPRRIFLVAAGCLVALPALWVGTPGIAGRVVVGIPLAFAQALIWPLAKAESLVADPKVAGAVQAVSTFFPLLPLALLESGLAQAVGMGTALVGMAAAGAGLMVATSLGRPWRGESRRWSGIAGPLADP